MSDAYKPDWIHNIARGQIHHGRIINKYGRNTSISSVTPEDIWDGGGSWTKPTQARIHNISSTSASDTAGGAGARSVEVTGLDANGYWHEELVALSGVTPVQTAASYITIFRLATGSAGGTTGNIGNVSAVAQTDGTTTAVMLAGNNQTQMAIFTVPYNREGFLKQYYFSTRGSKAADLRVEIYIKHNVGDVDTFWHLAHTNNIYAAAQSYVRHEFAYPFYLRPGTDIRCRATSDAIQSAEISAGFDIALF